MCGADWLQLYVVAVLTSISLCGRVKSVDGELSMGTRDGPNGYIVNEGLYFCRPSSAPHGPVVMSLVTATDTGICTLLLQHVGTSSGLYSCSFKLIRVRGV